MKTARTSSISFNIIVVIFASILLFATALIVISTFSINSSFHELYIEKLSNPSRILLSQHSYADIGEFIEKIKSRENYIEELSSYLQDREYIADIVDNYRGADYLPELLEAQERLNQYSHQITGLKGDKYNIFAKNMVDLRNSTGISSVYVIADVGLDGGYMYLYSTFNMAETGVYLLGDY